MRGRQHPSDDPATVARAIGDEAEALARWARDARLHTLGYLLDCAVMEAREQEKRGGQPGQ